MIITVWAVLTSTCGQNFEEERASAEADGSVDLVPYFLAPESEKVKGGKGEKGKEKFLHSRASQAITPTLGRERSSALVRRNVLSSWKYFPRVTTFSACLYLEERTEHLRKAVSVTQRHRDAVPKAVKTSRAPVDSENVEKAPVVLRHLL